MTLPDPVIVIPGVTAVYLRDYYPLPPDDVWTVLNLDYLRATPHPDNVAIEAQQPAMIRTGQIYEIAYKEIIEELRHGLSPSPNKPVPVYPFSYDWRQRLEKTEVDLSEFIEDVIQRTSVMRHYVQDGYLERPRVTLIGHSMGGLIAAGYIDSFKDKRRVGKVVTLAAPWNGSFESVIKVTTGTANLGVSPPSSREREAARVTPSLYYLLPDVPDGLVIDEPTFPKTLFDPGLWQPSILSSIETTIQTFGANPNGVPQQAKAFFKNLLDAAAAYRQRTTAFRLDETGLKPTDWLCVVGVNATTRVRLEVVSQNGAPDFRFHTSDRDNQWANRDPGQQIYTGDEVVPFDGAVPSFLDRSDLVCVTPEDYGYWEIGNKIENALAPFHALLPNMNMLHRMIIRFLTGAPDDHENTWGKRAPGVSHWTPPLALTEK